VLKIDCQSFVIENTGLLLRTTMLSCTVMCINIVIIITTSRHVSTWSGHLQVLF
jgi:hypothetical protein